MRYMLLFLIIFDPQIPYFINGIGFTAIIFPWLAAAYLIRNNGRIAKASVLGHAKFFAVLHLVVLFYSLVVIFVAGANYEYLLSVAKSIIVFCAVVSYLLYYRPQFDEKFFSRVLFLYCLNAAINFLGGTFPEYFWWTEVFRGRVLSDSIGLNPYRNNFISGSGYYAIGTAYGLFCLLYIYFGSAKKNNFLESVGLIFAAIAGFVGARTSMFAIGAGVAYMLKRFQVLKLLVLTAIGTLLLYFVLDEGGILGPYKAWLLGFFKGREDVSANYVLNEMFFWPGGEIFFLGSGFADSAAFTYSDSGFMQDILFGGILFMLVKFAFPLYFAARFFRKDPVFVMLFLGVAITYQMKGAFFTNNAQGMAIFYIMYFFFCGKYSVFSRGEGGRAYIKSEARSS